MKEECEITLHVTKPPVFDRSWCVEGGETIEEARNRGKRGWSCVERKKKQARGSTGLRPGTGDRDRGRKRRRRRRTVAAEQGNGKKKRRKERGSGFRVRQLIYFAPCFLFFIQFYHKASTYCINN